MQEIDERKIPVIAAIGEVCHRPEELNKGLEPVDLMVKSLMIANKELNNQAIENIDSIDLVGQVTWRYVDPVKLLCRKLNISPKKARNASMGGETPVRLVHEAALRIAEGKEQVCAIVGAESTNAKRKAKAAGVSLDWTPKPSIENTVVVDEQTFPVNYAVTKFGIVSPAHCYPLYELAYQAAHNQSPEEGNIESANLCQQFGEVAAKNPFAWIKTAPCAEEIKTVTDNNRLIAYPYPKFMVANSSVNQSAAIIVTSLAWAKAAGISEKQLVHIWGGTCAREKDDFLERDQFAYSNAQNAVLDEVVQLLDGDSSKIDAAELYSCFPIVPKLAMQRLSLRENVKPTVTGGLTFFGGPFNNYMAHSIAAMVRQLRTSKSDIGLLYANGGLLTKHHALIISSIPAPNLLKADYSVQTVADKNALAVPKLDTEYIGLATVETYTLLPGRDGFRLGFVVLLTPNGCRTVARVDADDHQSITVLSDILNSAVGREGDVFINEYGDSVWRIC